MIQTPQADPGKWKALGLAALIHAALIAFLVYGIAWQSRPPASVEVEVWRPQNVAVPQPAPESPPPAPPPEPPKPEPKPEPKPAPRPEPPPAKPDIAVKHEKPPVQKPKPEPTPKPRPEPPPARPSFADELRREQRQIEQQKAVQERLARADQEARMLAEAKAEQASAARRKTEAAYGDKIRAKVRGNVFLPPNIRGNPESIYEIVQLPSGEVIDVRRKKSSGNPQLDEAVERAIWKSSPLPKPDSGEPPRSFEIRYKPIDE